MESLKIMSVSLLTRIKIYFHVIALIFAFLRFQSLHAQYDTLVKKRQYAGQKITVEQQFVLKGKDTIWPVKSILINDKSVLKDKQLNRAVIEIPVSSLGIKKGELVKISIVCMRNSKVKLNAELGCIPWVESYRKNSINSDQLFKMKKSKITEAQSYFEKSGWKTSQHFKFPEEDKRPRVEYCRLKTGEEDTTAFIVLFYQKDLVTAIRYLNRQNIKKECLKEYFDELCGQIENAGYKLSDSYQSSKTYKKDKIHVGVEWMESQAASGLWQLQIEIKETP